MNVLHLPTNIASQISVTVRALNAIGVHARGLTWNNSPLCDERAIENYPGVSMRCRPAAALARRGQWYRAVRRALRWADVVHWHFNARTLPFDLDLRYAARLNKPRLIEFWGTDIRVPEIAARDNPYFARMDEASGEPAGKRARASLETQRRFARFGFECLLPGLALVPHVAPGVFGRVHFTRARVFLPDYEPRYPEPREGEPLVVHAPSNKARKGADAVLAAIERLRRTHRFRFELIHGLARDQALGVIGRCDVFLDQFVMGSHGLAALEAMALGKPCLCYITPAMAAQYPQDLPLVQTTQDTLADTLAALLDDGVRRHELGRRGRLYVEKYHDATRLARELTTIYEGLIERARLGSRG